MKINYTLWEVLGQGVGMLFILLHCSGPFKLVELQSKKKATRF